jgi:tetratricopeptide (TPR) repeat protein
LKTIKKTPWPLMVFFVVVCIQSACSGTENIDSLYKSAIAQMDTFPNDTNGMRNATLICRKMIEEDSINPLTHIAVGRLIMSLGYKSGENYDADALSLAMKHIETSIESDPKILDAYYYGTFMLLFAHDPARAKEYVKTAEAIDPGSDKALVLKAKIAMVDKKYEEAEKQAVKAIAAAKSNGVLMQAYYILRYAYSGEKKYALIENVYNKTMELFPNDPWEHINFSDYLLYRGQIDKAIMQAKIALQLMDFGMGHRVLSDAYSRKGDDLFWTKHLESESEKYFSLALEQNPRNASACYGMGSIYYNRAYAHRSEQELHYAEKYLVLALKLNPELEQAKILLSEINRHKNRR